MGTSPKRTVLLLVLAGVTTLAIVVAILARDRRLETPTARSGPIPGPAADSGALAVSDDRVPHPLFPTASAAGTEKLFHLEQPARGPEVTGVKLPRERGGLRWSTHGHCEMDHAGLSCGPVGRPAAVHWRVGRGPRRVLGERLLRGTVTETALVERAAAGQTHRIASFNGHGVIEEVRSFDPPGTRYSARGRNGANRLQGCGFIALGQSGDGADEVTCLQWLLKPMRDAAGVAIRRLRRDATGLVVEERRYDVKGAPTSGKDGVHRLVTRRDAAGRPLRVSGFDIDGGAVVSTDTGCHARQRTYGADGLEVEVRCLGPDGRLAPDRDEVAIVRHEHDGRGCRVAEVHLDADSRPAAGARGVQVVRREVNALCEPVRKTCHRDGRVACGPGEPAEVRSTRDGLGQVIRAQHRGPAGEPAGDAEYGAFEMRYRHDERGNLTAESCFDPESRAVICGHTGFHRVESRYDAAGRKVEDRFFDTQGQPATNLGTFVRRFRHDAYDHLRESQDFDEEGKPVESLGSASRRYLYDASHRLFGMLQLDRNGAPAGFRGCITGHTCPDTPWHAVRVMRSPKGRAVQNLFFDGDRRLIHRTDCTRAQCWD